MLLKGLELYSELDKFQSRVTAKQCSQAFLYLLKIMHRSVPTGIAVVCHTSCSYHSYVNYVMRAMRNFIQKNWKILVCNV